MLSPLQSPQINKPDFQLYIGQAHVFFRIFEKARVDQRIFNSKVDIVPQNRFLKFPSWFFSDIKFSLIKMSILAYF